MNRFSLRPFLFFVLVFLSTSGVTVWLADIVGGRAQSLLLWCLVAVFATHALWLMLVLWSSAIGFCLRHLSHDPLACVLPPEIVGRESDPIKVRTAIVMTIRDDDPVDVFRRLAATYQSLEQTAAGAMFDYFVLSDSVTGEAVAAEQREFLNVKDKPLGERLVYRRREINTDFKSGNLRDFCRQWGSSYDFMVILDADSIMAGAAITRLVRVMQANPRLGMLQTMIDCVMPPGGFPRIFEFGHRLVWHNYILGSAWWQRARGQYRGHNAAIRISAYMDHTYLADLIGEGRARRHIMCYDQVEASLMHRAGYEVWELPGFGGSFEGLPPTSHDIFVRYLRWYQGNLKNLRLIGLGGLRAIDRYHLIGVTHRFLSWPAFCAFVGLCAWLAITWPSDVQFPVRSAALLYGVVFLAAVLPKIFGLIDAAAMGAARYGGPMRLLTSAVLDLISALLFTPAVMIGSVFFSFSLLLGRRSTWRAQRRATYALSWSEAARSYWRQTIIGLALCAMLLVGNAAAFVWFLPFILGLVTAIPFARLTSSPRFASWLVRRRLCVMPEETSPPAELKWSQAGAH